MAAEPIPISALQHYVFCPRQCALIHVEGLWSENRLTVEGKALHRNAHGDKQGPRGGGRSTIRNRTRTVRGLALGSESLGLIGKADIVEFRSALPSQQPIPFPIEYKRGKPKRHDADLVQLCAQALCLEEMLLLPEGTVGFGAIYYGLTKHRLEVTIGCPLRARTRQVIASVREMLHASITPRAKRERKCARCSMLHLCMPNVTFDGSGASRFITRSLQLD